MNMPTNAVAVSNPKQLLDYLTKGKSAIEMALPKHLNADRMMRLALTCFSTQPALRNCSPQSILASVVVASQLGLEPGVAGQGYLIPYGKNCTFVPGWQGLVGLLNNTGRATAWTGSVFDGDEFDFSLGSAPRLVHKPGKNYGDPECLVWVYACGQVNGSQQPVVEAWPVERVRKHRDRFNKVGEKHYSYQHFEMYARKVVLLQVLKYMPRSIELNNAITAADAAEAGKAVVNDGGVIIEAESTDVEVQPEAAKPINSPAPVNLPKPAAPKPQPPAPPQAAAPKPAAPAPAATPAKPEPVNPTTPAPPAEPTPAPEPEPAPEPSEADQAESAEPPTPVAAEPANIAEAVSMVTDLATRDGITEGEVMAYLVKVKLAKSAKNISECTFAALKNVAKYWDTAPAAGVNPIGQQIKELAGKN